MTDRLDERLKRQFARDASRDNPQYNHDEFQKWSEETQAELDQAKEKLAEMQQIIDEMEQMERNRPSAADTLANAFISAWSMLAFVFFGFGLVVIGILFLHFIGLI
ncbi:hypothetical protein B0181_07525 [Moraxella caviae]|uniref:Uncharacterized protein n=1 Tax=Moraxella caviae TaxID=34060 RepID=A0A1T0A061_9GAMM|nr:hypothetical protein [Moraxella caviae]OOR89009.1 hypothetical protein B0181_07525 [Moraxella caviae]STZ14764.1 Uncharacterised protein [Moraxella caviae]VEW13975.1 Uncharacterised protein [Moraxella caviae]